MCLVDLYTQNYTESTLRVQRQEMLDVTEQPIIELQCMSCTERAACDGLHETSCKKWAAGDGQYGICCPGLAVWDIAEHRQGELYRTAHMTGYVR